MVERSGAGKLAGAYGTNAWLVEEMYESYLADPASVSESWREFFADYRLSEAPERARAVSERTEEPTGAPPAVPAAAGAPSPGAWQQRSPAGTEAPQAPPGEPAVPLRGAAARVVENMSASLSVPTATSVRPVPAKLLEVNRVVINDHLGRTTGGKVSFTHLIAWAIVKALGAVPEMNASFVPEIDETGSAGVVRHEHVGLGIAIDHERADGSRALYVPCVREADTLGFSEFLHAYEDLVRKVRTNRLAVDDFGGVTVTVTNPGVLGTTQSVPRLMSGQGAIIGVGALGYPAEFAASDPEVLAELGLSKVVLLSSTYDHRIIQGAHSALFLARVHELLVGEHGFYDEVFSSLQVPYNPARWHKDINPVGSSDGVHARLVKQAKVQQLVNMYRVRGHLIANLDPLGTVAPALHPELDPLTHGITIFDLDRSFVVEGLGEETELPLGRLLDILRDAYCRTIGIEYMHIEDPEEKRWIQQHVEGVPGTCSPEEQHHVLERLNAAEAFERFLHTRYVGQKRFGLEGAESAIPLLDAILDEAAQAGIEEAVLGMAHRGRLNVLANIVGKSYREIFAEFEGNLDPESVQGSGDVKYHKGASGKFAARNGIELPVTLASNPSHLEAVDPVVEGIARARHDQRRDPGRYHVLPVLVHGDAAFAGQGVVAETLELSQLRGYRTGGTVHLVINNQLGFTTPIKAARSSFYPTDVAKTVQAPIFHVNGDDPEACVRVGRLAVAFRQRFHKDVVIDMVCYRLHGHNEGDDPSYTQPLMYRQIDQHRSVRKLYTETLVKRGDITIEEAERALDDFSARLQAALDQTRASAPPRIERLPAPAVESPSPLSKAENGLERSVLDLLVATIHEPPEGFNLHPKLARQLQQRAELYEAGEVEWALAEALAFGGVLMEGYDVRLAGQDTRRGTFSQRHSVLFDYETGAEYTPLANLAQARGESPGAGPVGRFMVYDSLLSEFAALGFEYGYSVESSEALVAWEAQFGDFANGAQVVIDNFLASAGEKWGQSSALVLLLPHGYEGQGPEHSSARLERFLTICAGDNLTVAQPTTAAQYFHLLRAQAHRGTRRPLVVMTPKSLLRARQARSLVGELVAGSWREVLDDEAVAHEQVRRLVLCSGKVAYDAMARRDRLAEGEAEPVAVVRVEQLYPWPEDQISDLLASYPAANEVVWLQEEPENMGAWSFVHGRLHRLLGTRYQLRHVSRPQSGSPATGSSAIHQLEHEDILERSVGPLPG
ncbi:MAG: multifunctional oxoglutarate decarboxylase/oxoglutarate dehydrogenase thiamine pyrophosphate-binding subunit/dihydrolipoyllysine-residue succinyltransferase subunit [Acidimicrobiales bacterium]|jgi:2-oxoglutarate dehydrogenase E1 component